MSATDQYITRASFGNTANIGDLYDVRSEKLLHGINIFNRSLPDDFKILPSDITPTMDSHFVYSSKVSEKLSALDIHGEVSVSFLANLITGSGSIGYLSETANNITSVQYSFIQKIRTCQEKINMNDNRLKDLVVRNFDDYGGTHVVVGMTWGANATVTMTYNSSDEKAKTEVKGKLGIACEKLKAFAVDVKGEGEIRYSSTDNDLIKGVNLKVYADMLPTGIEAPTTLTSAMEFLQSMVKQFADTSTRTKGKQLQFLLIPLKIVQKVFKHHNIYDRLLINIEENVIKRLEQFFDAVFESLALLHELVKFVDDNEKITPPEDKDAIKKRANNYEVSVSQMRHNLGILLKEVRSGEKEAFEIEIIRSLFDRDSETSPAKTNEFVESFKPLKEKVAFMKEFQSNGVLVITESVQLANIKRHNQNKEIIMLFTSFSNDHDLPKWTETINFFYIMIKNPDEHVYAFIDTDIMQNMAKNESLPEGIRIVKYFNGRYLCIDCLEEQQNLDLQCLTRCENVYPYNEDQLQKAVSIKFPCPKSIGKGKCSKEKKEWFCSECRQAIYYNFDNYFYCHCGRNMAAEFAYKCSDRILKKRC